MTKIMVVAGEVSGDMHAARVVQELKKERPDLEFFGMGSDELGKQGVEILFDPTQISTIGFVEALKHLRKFYKLLDMLSREIDRRKPDLLFLVDYSGFNMKMAKIGRQKGVPVVNYFSPSAWVWGEWRAKRMAKYGARIAAVFPMEVDIYQKHGADLTFVGHPLLDMVEPEMDRQEFYDYLDLEDEESFIGLLPGSRPGEIESLLPTMVDAARLIYQQFPEMNFILPLASDRFREMVNEIIEDSKGEVPIKIITGHAYEVMDNSELILAASGTATLEAACLKTPMVIGYQTSLSTYYLGKLLTKIDYIGLPNIIMGKEVVPEFLQKEVTGQNLAEAVLKILKDEDRLEEMKEELARVRKALGEAGAVKRVANLILDTLEE